MPAPFINNVWSIESERQGQHIVIKDCIIEWAIYELPGTSFSAGSANEYKFDEMTLGSALYKDVVLVFGQQVANEMLVFLTAKNLAKDEDVQPGDAEIN